MPKKLARLIAETSGGVAVVTAIALVVICGAAALTVDLGHLASVKNELQTAADASALAGARALCTQIPGSLSFVDIPNWASGSTTTNYTLTKNSADRVLLASADIQLGLWDLTWQWSTAPKDASTGAVQLLPQSTPPDSTHLPAVRVKIDKKAGVNSGPVQFSLARTMGIDDANSSAQAVAAVFPRKGKGISSVPAQSCFPFATPISWVRAHWDDDPPTSFRIGSTYHEDDGGEWTSFLIDANNVPEIRDLIVNGNPTPIKVGDNIYIQPGTKSVLYSDLSVDIGKIGLLPIVMDDFATHEYTPLLAFVAFYLEGTGGSGSSAYVQGHFVKGYVDYDATPGNPDGSLYFGADAATPSLVR
jgi:Flp pilus assembly protein TadG